MKTRTQLETKDDILRALKLGFVFCDITNPQANHLPVRDVRAFKTNRSLEGIPLNNPKWTELAFQGNAKGYEVLVLEGWKVPERVYTEK